MKFEGLDAPNALKVLIYERTIESFQIRRGEVAADLKRAMLIYIALFVLLKSRHTHTHTDRRIGVARELVLFHQVVQRRAIVVVVVRVHIYAILATTFFDLRPSYTLQWQKRTCLTR